MEEFEGVGWFWLPGQDGKRHPGTLRFTRERGGRLELQGIQAPGRLGEPLVSHAHQPVRLLGLVNNEPVTIEDADVFRSSMTDGGSTLAFGLMYRQVSIEHERPLSFVGMNIGFERLPQWVGAGNPYWNLTSATEDLNQLEAASIHVDKTETKTIAIPDGTLALAHGWKIGGRSQLGESTLTSMPTFRFRYATPRTHQEMTDDAVAVQNLLTIAYGKTCHVSRLSFLLAADDATGFSEETVENNYEETDVMSWGRLGLWRHYREASKRDHFRFHLASIGDMEGLARWIVETRKVGRAVSLILSLRHDNTSLIENRMQNASGAVEAYHRQHSQFSNALQPKAEFRKLRRELKGLLPEEHREWFEEQVEHGNEPRLYHRLLDVVEHAGQEGEDIVGGDIFWWSREVRKMRNSLVHSTSARPEADYERMHYLIESIYHVLVLSLFRDCEFPNELDERFTSGSAASSIKERLREMRQADEGV